MDRVIYVMSGRAHLPYLIVSLYTLRDHFSGPVQIFVWPESQECVEEIVKDKRLGYISCRPWNPDYRGKNAQFICKQHVMASLPPRGVNLYLDADTMVRGPLDPVFRLAEGAGFCATQFNHWLSSGRGIQKRLARLRGRIPEMEDLLDSLRDRPWPSVNGGVFACRSDSPVLPNWIDWTWQFRDIFIADETALHPIVAKFFPENLSVSQEGRFNSSPKFRSPELTDEDVHVWHFHGDSNVRPNKSKKGLEMWWPVYQECLSLNLGNIRAWLDTVNNKWLNRLAEEQYVG